MAGEDYIVDRSQQWTDKAFELIQSKKLTVEVVEAGEITGVRVDGPCPRCGDHISVFQATTVPAPKARRLLRRSGSGESVAGSKAGTVRAPVTCNCAEQHSDKAAGCGTSFAVEARR